jgi:hypothetical protein
MILPFATAREFGVGMESNRFRPIAVIQNRDAGLGGYVVPPLRIPGQLP